MDYPRESQYAIDIISLENNYFYKIKGFFRKSESIKLERDCLKRVAEYRKQEIESLEQKLDRLKEDKVNLYQTLEEVQKKLSELEEEKYRLRKYAKDYAYCKTPDEVVYENYQQYAKDYEENEQYYLRYHKTDCPKIAAFHDYKHRISIAEAHGCYSHLNH